MKYIKKFEKKYISEYYSEALKNFFDSYNYNFNDKLKVSIKSNAVSFYSLPEFVLDEYCMLLFYYNNRRKWATEYKNVNDYIKKEVKKLAIDNIVQKIIDNPENYTILADSIEFIRNRRYPSDNRNLFYILFLFEDALQKVPEYIKNSLKYNL